MSLPTNGHARPITRTGSTSGAQRHYVCHLAELPPGARKIITVTAFGRNIEIGVFNVNGRLVAYRNVCPHAGAPVCVGKVCGTTLPSKVYEYNLARDGEILRCPWHGWEFDLFTGEHLVDEKMRLRSYEVGTEPGGGADRGGKADAATQPVKDENLQGYVVETDDDRIYVLV
jgi:nitrite reductase/ring-hydroxylating ferredoxin subunit